MMPIHDVGELVAGDTAPAILQRIVDDDHNAVDFTGATVHLLYSLNGAVEVEKTSADGVHVVSPSVLGYAWHTGELVAGTLVFRWRVTFGDGTVATTNPPHRLSIRA